MPAIRVSPIKRVLSLLGVVVFLGTAGPVTAAGQTNAVPSRVVLEASVDTRPLLEVLGPSGSRRLSLAELESLPLHRVATSTFWPGDEGVFEGPLLSDVLGLAGLADADAIRAAALDDFAQIIPAEDWKRWPVIVATRHNGAAIPVRAKGPLRIVYPRDMDPALQEPVYRLRWVWLLKRIEVVAR